MINGNSGRNQGASGKFKGTDRDEIRQIQMLMILSLCLSPQGKLRELLEMALATSGDEIMKTATPVSDDVSVDGLYDWLNDLFTRKRLTKEEKNLLKWQNDRNNMLPAISELKSIQEKLGFQISIEKRT